MTVHRTRPLPVRPSRGSLIVAEQVVQSSARLLRAPRHQREERLVFWLGRNVDADTIVVSVCAPTTRNGPGGVFYDELGMGDAATAARTQRLGIVTQVHTHPGTDTRHSDGDDDLALMPYEGMFSLVIAEYGRGSLLPGEGAGLHQYQDGQWIQVANEPAALVIVPEILR